MVLWTKLLYYGQNYGIILRTIRRERARERQRDRRERQEREREWS